VDSSDESLDSNQDQNQVWTSNSDLFMAVAVVFLMMFVYALLAASVEKIHSAQIEQEQKMLDRGLIPKRQKVQHDKDVKQLTASISDIDTQQKILDDYLSKVQMLSKTISERKKTLTRLQEGHLNKNIALQKANKLIRSQSFEINSLVNNIQDLSLQLNKAENQNQNKSEKIQKMNKHAKMQDEKIAMLKTITDSKEKDIKKLQQNVLVREQSLDNKERVVEAKDAFITKLKATIEANDKKIAGLNSNIKSQKDKLYEQNQTNKKLDNNIKNYQEKLSKSNQANQNLGKELNEQKALNGTIKTELTSVGKSLSASRSQLEAFGKKENLFDKEMMILKKKNQELKKMVNTEKKKTEQAEVKLTHTEKKAFTEKQQLKQTQQKMKKQAAYKEREIKKLKNQAYHKELRKVIASNMAVRFKDLGIDVALDRKTGKIFLRSDQSYLFANDSFTVQEDMQLKLKKLIPVYAEELLSNPKISPLITDINIVGHASPRFEGKPVDPIKADSRAYRFNMRLSINRANAVANHIFHRQFGEFSNKEKFRGLLAVSGMSFSRPISAEQNQNALQTVPDKQQAPCGIYDCTQSRRVEISFGLREDVSGVKNLMVH